MTTVGIDHIAMPTSDAVKLIGFYKRIGFTINDEEARRAGKANIFSIQIGDSKINVHPEVTPPPIGDLPQSLVVPTSASFGKVPPMSANRCLKTLA